MKTKIFFSVLLAAIFFITNKALVAYFDSFKAVSVVNNLNGNIHTNAFMSVLAGINVEFLMVVLFVCCMIGLWKKDKVDK